MVEYFRKTTSNGFNYLFEKELDPKEKVYVKIPDVSSNKRGITDIGWQTDGDAVKIYGTLSDSVCDCALWQYIAPETEINKTISGLKIENEGETKCKVAIRVLMS